MVVRAALYPRARAIREQASNFMRDDVAAEDVRRIKAARRDASAILSRQAKRELRVESICGVRGEQRLVVRDVATDVLTLALTSLLPEEWHLRHRLAFEAVERRSRRSSSPPKSSGLKALMLLMGSAEPDGRLIARGSEYRRLGGGLDTPAVLRDAQLGRAGDVQAEQRLRRAVRSLPRIRQTLKPCPTAHPRVYRPRRISRRLTASSRRARSPGRRRSSDPDPPARSGLAPLNGRPARSSSASALLGRHPQNGVRA
jgi:hypothetical protein